MVHYGRDALGIGLVHLIYRSGDSGLVEEARYSSIGSIRAKPAFRASMQLP